MTDEGNLMMPTIEEEGGLDAAVRLIARHVAREGRLPEEYKRPEDPAVARTYEAALLLAGTLLRESDVADADSPQVQLTARLTAVAVAEAFVDGDMERAQAVLPPGAGELALVAGALAGLVVQLLTQLRPGAERTELAGVREWLLAGSGDGAGEVRDGDAD